MVIKKDKDEILMKNQKRTGKFYPVQYPEIHIYHVPNVHALVNSSNGSSVETVLNQSVCNRVVLL